MSQNESEMSVEDQRPHTRELSASERAMIEARIRSCHKRGFYWVLACVPAFLVFLLGMAFATSIQIASLSCAAAISGGIPLGICFLGVSNCSNRVRESQRDLAAGEVEIVWEDPNDPGEAWDGAPFLECLKHSRSLVSLRGEPVTDFVVAYLRYPAQVREVEDEERSFPSRIRLTENGDFVRSRRLSVEERKELQSYRSQAYPITLLLIVAFSYSFLGIGFRNIKQILNVQLANLGITAAAIAVATYFFRHNLRFQLDIWRALKANEVVKLDEGVECLLPGLIYWTQDGRPAEWRREHEFYG